MIEVDPIIIQHDLPIDTKQVHVLEFLERVMHNHTIKYVNILRSNQTERETIWELESTMRNKYPYLFEIDKFFVVYILPIFLCSVVEATEFEDEFFLRGKNVTPKKD
jgi:hypothetical protein